MLVEAYLRRGKRSLQRLARDPKVRSVGTVAAYGGSGFLMSAASVGGFAQPLAMGLICATTGWRTLVMALGAMAGYPTFWGSGGSQGIVWSAAGGLLALLVGKKEESREQPLMIPAIAAFLTAVAGISFYFLVGEEAPPAVYALRIALAFFTAVLFTQCSRCRDVVTDWLAGGVAVLALARVRLGGLCLGGIAAGILAVGAPFPAAVVAGLGLDLAQVTPLPMTAVLCLACFLGMIPYDKKWQHYASPGFACLLLMGVCGIWDLEMLPGLALGGAMGAWLPPNASHPRRRGETGAAQVRLEVGAALLKQLQQTVEEAPQPELDVEGLLDRVKSRACATCPAGKDCAQRENLTAALLLHPLEADCKKQTRLIPELRRAGEQRKLWKADCFRRQEYREALQQQYGFLSAYLRTLADRLPRSAGHQEVQFRVEASSRTRGKERANGDRCISFPGPECRYFVLLCDGMGTGAGAAREGEWAAQLLRSLLSAAFPAEYALRWLNSILALRGCAGAVTVDLAELHLDTGHVHLYKWGAAPSWVLTRSGAEKIGTATPPPGISVKEGRETVMKLSLRRGEVLMLLSDGVDGEEIQRLSDLSPDLPPGELAAKLLEMGSGKAEDDATAAVIRLRPANLSVA